jgi:hypothetical protein
VNGKRWVLEIHSPDQIVSFNSLGLPAEGWVWQDGWLVHQPGDYEPQCSTQALADQINNVIAAGVFPVDVPYKSGQGREEIDLGEEESGPPVLSSVQRDALSRIVGYALAGYGVGEDRAAHVRAEFESCVDGWLGGSFTPPAEIPTGGESR